MRKLVAIIALGGLFCLGLLPTASFAAEIRGGLKAGASLATIHGADVSSVESELGGSWGYRFGFAAGAFVTFSLSTNLAIQAEALYIMKGARISSTAGGVTATGTLKADYLDIPLLLKIMIPTQGNLKPSIMVGPALGIDLTHKFRVEAEGVSAEMDIPGWKSTDLGLVLGLGLDIGRNIRTDLRYTLGFTKLVEEAGVTSDIKNGAFSLMVGYCF